MTIPQLIAFEGVDGAGKTTVLSLVAEALRQQGVRVFLPREGKEHQSHPTRLIRRLTRDPRNLELSPRAELAMYCAREAQVLDELVRPALARGETVLVDRSMLTPVVLGCFGRGLERAQCEAMAQAAAARVAPELTLIFDVHPRTSRIRKRIEKVRTKTLGAGGRKGLAGSGLKERIREGYLTVASQSGYPVFHAERATPAQVAERVIARILHQVPPTESEKPEDAIPVWQVDPKLTFEQALACVPPAVALFLTNGLRAGRQLRRQHLEQEPELVSWALDFDDPLREAAARLEPDYALRGITRRPMEGNEDPRYRWLESSPYPVISSLKHLQCEASDSLRQRFADIVPGAVLASLVGREDDFAQQLRERCWKAGNWEERATSLTFCAGAKAWALREPLLEREPRLGIESLRGVRGERADRVLETFSDKAEKPVLRALSGRTDDFAHELRRALLPVGREVVDSIRGLDDEGSWQLREAFIERSPSTVLNSLTGLDPSALVSRVRAHCEAQGAGDLHTLRRSCGLDEYPGRPAWARTRAALGDTES